MIWILLAPLQFLFTVVCYLTNPIVALFANEVGELPKIFKLWQTWDNSCDVRFMVLEKVPKWAVYNFDSKYITKTRQLETTEYNVKREYVELLPGATFTIKERLQRYFCRCAWLYRNPAYGLAFYVMGRYVKGSDNVIIKDVNDPGYEFYISYEKSKSLWMRAWKLYYDNQYCSKYRFRVYIGWKISKYYTGEEPIMSMIAFHINPMKPV